LSNVWEGSISARFSAAEGEGKIWPEEQDELQVSDRHSKRIMKRPAYFDSTLNLPKRRTLKSALTLLGAEGEQLLLQTIESQPRTGPKFIIKETDKAIRAAISKHCVSVTKELSAMLDQASGPQKQAIHDLGVFLRKCGKDQFKTLTAVQRNELAIALDKIDPPSRARKT
jgi:hypothetical protein